jgi:tRNA-binding EMAP/Myf-like protein
MKTLTIKTIEREFPNQWLLVEVLETKDGIPSRGMLLKASSNRKPIVDAIEKYKEKKLLFFFSGTPASPDTAFALALSHR